MLHTPEITEAEARREGFELEDYEADIAELEIWPDNEMAVDFWRRIGTRWQFGPMGGPPAGLRWEAVYPLVDVLGLSREEHMELLDDLAAMEAEALATIREYAPKPKS